MTEHCQNDLCKNEALWQVPISIHRPCDQKRALCAACKQAYDWGVQHGRTTAPPKRVWVLAVTEMGLVIYNGAFRTRPKAVQGLAQYLQAYQGYRGPAEMPGISDWLAQQAQDLGVDIFPAPLHAG
jgi:hypothetical protein